MRAEGASDQEKRLDNAVAKARRKDNRRAFAKLAARTNRDARIVADPPLVVPVEELLDERQAHARLRSRVRGRLLPPANSDTSPRCPTSWRCSR